MATPGWSARLRGRDVFPSKPGERANEALDEVRRLWRRAGLVVEVYCPGRRSRLVAAPDADNVAPTT